MMPDVAHAAMESLLALHETQNIELWNPKMSTNTFWSISSEVPFSISQKLILHQIYEYTSLLRWLREILVLHNAYFGSSLIFLSAGGIFIWWDIFQITDQRFVIPFFLFVACVSLTAGLFDYGT
ncbi:unnamed protein product [Rotaria sp. Silwood2]|nr:unnamed protein product [Rotaria sp. Silwood2]